MISSNNLSIKDFNSGNYIRKIAFKQIFGIIGY